MEGCWREIRQTLKHFSSVWCTFLYPVPRFCLLPTRSLLGKGVGGGGVLVPTQFPSHKEKNGLRFPFIPYPPHQAGRPVCLCSLISGDI